MRQVSETVLWERVSLGGEDTHGYPVESYDDPVDVGVYAFDPGSSSEPRLPGQDRVIVEPTVYMPSRWVFGPGDRVTARGKQYEVEGETREWRHPNGPRKGNVVTLRRVDG